MNYNNKEVVITGFDGFIGRTLERTLKAQGAIVKRLPGDVRDPETFASLNYETDYLFHLAAPSSQVLFARNKAYCSEVTIKGFINAADACKKNGIKLIYPSTGLLSQRKTNDYASCKLISERYAEMIGVDSLGIRIFATYGPSEGHKRDYASVPYLFASEMVANRQPVVFGDGSQTRDFIYIDDTVLGIMELAERCNDPVVDLGSGNAVSFNDIIALINEQLSKPIMPFYVDSPKGYVSETLAKSNDIYSPVVSIQEGVKRVVNSLKRGTE